VSRPIISCPTTDETRARVAAAWDEYDKAVKIDGPADEWDKRVIDRVIHAMADQGHPFSVNDFRELLPQVRNCLISHRLRAAMNAGVIERVGKVPSDLKSTHGHEINVYRGTR
jgi:hypothetical protein